MSEWRTLKDGRHIPLGEPTLAEGIHISEITSQKMKSALGVQRAMKRYHNKHKDGSGNFGYTLYKGDQCYDLSGDYDNTGRVYALHFGTCSRIFGSVTVSSCSDACGQIRMMMKRHEAGELCPGCHMRPPLEGQQYCEYCARSGPPTMGAFR